MHKGIDFGARWGSPIVASADGVVSRAGWAGGYGQQVRIAHASAIATSYSHMSRILVAPGSPVRQGQLIGYVGSSGLSTGPHLHYETYRGGVAVNPLERALHQRRRRRPRRSRALQGAAGAAAGDRPRLAGHCLFPPAARGAMLCPPSKGVTMSRLAVPLALILLAAPAGVMAKEKGEPRLARCWPADRSRPARSACAATTRRRRR